MENDKLDNLEKDVLELKQKINTILELLYLEASKENDRFLELEKKINELKV